MESSNFSSDITSFGSFVHLIYTFEAEYVNGGVRHILVAIAKVEGEFRFIEVDFDTEHSCHLERQPTPSIGAAGFMSLPGLLGRAIIS